MVAGCALCESNEGEHHVEWSNHTTKALYMDRFAVHEQCARKGIGSMMLTHAKAYAKDVGAQASRLFVVDYNEPAIQFYEKQGFIKAKGVFDECLDEDYVLHEYGYEVKV